VPHFVVINNDDAAQMCGLEVIFHPVRADECCRDAISFSAEMRAATVVGLSETSEDAEMLQFFKLKRSVCLSCLQRSGTK
jgi:ribulose 1,5-bisphosphate synthetase/thiazole synthase